MYSCATPMLVLFYSSSLATLAIGYVQGRLITLQNCALHLVTGYLVTPPLDKPDRQPF